MNGNDTSFLPRNGTPGPPLPGGGFDDSTFPVLVKLVPISAAIALTNGLVFALFASKKQLRTGPNILLLSLAVVDFLTGTLCIPLFIFYLIPTPISPESIKDIVYSVSILHNFFAVAAAYHILVVTAEKYFAITQPFKHRMLGKKTIGRGLAGVWSIAAVVSLLPVSWFNNRGDPLLTSVHAIFCSVAVFVVPYTFIIYMQIMTFRTATRTVAAGLCEIVSRSQARMANHRKCLYIFAAMATIFAMCWLPWFSLMIIFSLKIQNETSDKVAEIFLFVRYLTSVVNPLLYTFLKRDFLKAFKEFVGCGKTGLRRRLTQTESLRKNSRKMFVRQTTEEKDEALATEADTMVTETNV